MAREFYRRPFRRLRYAARPIRLPSESTDAIIAGRAGKSAGASKTIDPTGVRGLLCFYYYAHGGRLE